MILWSEWQDLNLRPLLPKMQVPVHAACFRLEPGPQPNVGKGLASARGRPRFPVTQAKALHLHPRKANGAAFVRRMQSNEEFKRRIKTLPSADTAAMLFWALLASGEINMRQVDGWQSLATKPIDQPIDLAA